MSKGVTSRMVANIVESSLTVSLRGDGVKLERGHTTTGSEMVILTIRSGERFNITITKARS